MVKNQKQKFYAKILLTGAALLKKAPEVLKGTAHTQESDVYSLGVTCWEIINQFYTGEYSYPYPTTAKATESISHGKTPIIPPSCHIRLRALLLECWKFKPEERITAPKLVLALSEIDPKEPERETEKPPSKFGGKTSFFPTF